MAPGPRRRFFRLPLTDRVLPFASQEKAAKLFALVDKDGDGQLTEEEMKQVRLKRGCYARHAP